MNKGKKSDNQTKDIENIFTTREHHGIKSDVLGSYTGTGDKDEKPEQDADDL